MHAEIFKKGFDKDILINNTLVDTYAQTFVLIFCFKVCGDTRDNNQSSVMHVDIVTKDSWLAIVLHKTGLGRIITSFTSIFYFVADKTF